MRISLLCLITMVLLASCAKQVSEGEIINTVSGTVSYREKMALSPDAVINVKLLDVSLADIPAVTLGEQTIKNPGNVPVSFSITYDPLSIDERHSYAVRAEIRDQGQLIFTTDRNYPVITHNTGNNTDLMLLRISRKNP
jgi:uncharacterized lipoprotein YbaY